MPEDIHDTFYAIGEFPFATEAFSEIGRYIRLVNEFLSHGSDQLAVRINARLACESDPVREGELMSELDAVNQDAAITLPRLVWGGVFVSIFAAFENGVTEALKHWQLTTKCQEEFRKKPRKDFIWSAEKYSKDFLGVELFHNKQLKTSLSELKAFRNNFVHESGLLLGLPQSLVNSIDLKRHAGVDLKVIDGKWVANARAATYYLLSAESAIKKFNDDVLDKCLEVRRPLSSKV